MAGNDEQKRVTHPFPQQFIQAEPALRAGSIQAQAMSKGTGTTLRFGVTALLGLGLATAVFTTTPKPWALTIVGMGLGCLAGHMRSRAIAAGVAARMANALGWLCGISLLVLAMAFAEDMFPGAWAASVFGYLLADRVLSFPAACRRARTAASAVTDATQQ